MKKTVGDAMARPVKGLKRVGEYNPGSVWESRPKLEMVAALDTELVIEGIAERTGENGPYLIIGVKTVGDTPEEFYVTTGGLVVMKKLKLVEEADGFPCVGTFTQHVSEVKGRTGYYDIA